MGFNRGGTYLQNHLSVLPRLAKPSRTTSEDILNAFDQQIDEPLRMHAAIEPDDKLYIGSSSVALGDGTSRSVGPKDGFIPDFPFTSISFSTGNVTGGSVRVDASPFSLPTASNPGVFYRVAFVYNHENNNVVAGFSSEETSVALLPNAGSIFDLLDGSEIGYLDIESISNTQYKSAGATLNVIENKAITRFGFGSGGGGGGLGAITPSWSQPDTDGAAKLFEFGFDTFILPPGDDQVYVSTIIKVPETYSPGKQLSLKAAAYTPSGGNQFDLQVRSFLIKKETTAVNDNALTYTSPSNPISSFVAYTYRELTLHLTDVIGQVGTGSVERGDVLRVELFRNAGDSDPEDIRFLPVLTEVTF